MRLKIGLTSEQRKKLEIKNLKPRFGIKKYSKFPLGQKSLIVIWFINEVKEEEIITAYWRRNKRWEK